MVQAGRRRPHSTEDWARSEFSTRGICGRQSGSAKSYSAGTWISPCQYYPITTRQIYMLLLLWTNAKNMNIPQINALTEMGDYSIRKYFHFFSLRSIDAKIFSVRTDEF
jgi:hypothetical protein